MNYDKLIANIQFTHESLLQTALRSVNICLSIRNLLIGYYIVEYEQNGEDRARYGTKLLKNLAENILIKGLTSPELSRCRQFYRVYFPILNLVCVGNESLLPDKILGLLTQEFISKSLDPILGSATQELELKAKNDYVTHYKHILSKISYTHLVELIKIDDSLKRRFYELLVINSQLSVRELKRQIETLAFERLGLSGDYEKALEELKCKIVPETSADIVKTYYFFDFLNFRDGGLVTENELEHALLSHLQEFILELGHGFCFEARQKRILIEDENFYIDLVFYHRILKCHVIIELKTQKAKHEHIGQLKSYIQFYKRNIMMEGDNPPVGILLVTDQNKTLVEYAIAEQDKEIFVSKYAVELPRKEDLEAFINKELKSRNA